MTRYIVIGAGAVGATVAAQLHLAGTPVLLVARGAHLAALRETGLRYVRPDRTVTLAVPTVDGPGQTALTPDDVLVVATKSQDTDGVLAAWAWQPVTRADGGTAVAAEELPILLLQNGIANEPAALRRFTRVLGAMVRLPATFLTPGEVVAPAASTVGAFYLGRYPGGDDPAVAPIAADLRAAGFAVQEVPDVARWKAAKLLVNLGNAVDALYRPSPLRDRAWEALRAEGRQVLAAAGVDVADVAAETTIDVSGVRTVPIPGHPVGNSSTWQSLAKAGEPETDFLNGEIVALAQLSGVDAPLNRAIQLRLHRARRDGTPAGSLGGADLAATLGLAPAVLISPAELRERLAGHRPPVVLDVRWALGDPDGREHYRAGHIPTAVYVDLDTELAAPPSAEAGRHPLPDLADLQAAARRWGIGAGRTVVAYDDLGGQAAARAWWLLRWAGVEDVLLLDGAWRGWLAAGYETATGDESATEPGDVTLTGGGMPTLSADRAAELARTGILLDARAGERYRGEVEPVDPRAGHIPGAISAPTVENLDVGGAMLPADRLRERFSALGVRAGDGPVGVYCGSGVTAAHEAAALAVIGVEAMLYPGSWSQWSSDPDRPIATGPEPGTP